MQSSPHALTEEQMCDLMDLAGAVFYIMDDASSQRSTVTVIYKNEWKSLSLPSESNVDTLAAFNLFLELKKESA